LISISHHVRTNDFEFSYFGKGLGPCCLPWYAIRTKSNCEKIAALGLESRGYEHYLPLYRSRRRWSDRTVESDQPLFPGYLFCRFDVNQRVPIMITPGVASIVGLGMHPAPVSETEIETVRMILLRGSGAEPCPYIQEGQRVRIARGSLEGLQGILLKTKSEWRVVVSVTMLQRSVSVDIDRECVSAV
jgi:transcription elongation factor/antiterminator RfaH